MPDIADAVVVQPGPGSRMKAVALLAVTPQAIATVSTMGGIGLVIAGVFILAGTGWALLAGAAPLLLLSVILIRGLIRAG